MKEVFIIASDYESI